MNKMMKIVNVPASFSGKRLFSTNLSRSIPQISDSIGEKIRQKHRIPVKRASKLLNELQNEEFDKLKNGRSFPQVKAGDSIEVHQLPYMTSSEVDVIKGLVIGITNRNSDTAVKLLNVEYGTPVYRRLILYSPLVKDVKVLQKAFIHKGRKRVRRSKLYYLKERHPETYTVK